MMMQSARSLLVVRRTWVMTSVVALALGAADARADVSAAARAFSDGQAAQLEGNNDRAAQSFELAFSIAPSKEALRSAIRARQLSDQLARAATLAQILLTQYADDPVSTKLANDVIAEARLRLARISVTCAPRCALAVGGRAISINVTPSHVVFVTPGHQVLEVTFDGDQSVTRDVNVKAGDGLVLSVDKPAAKPGAKPAAPAVTVAPAPAEDRGLSPMFAVTGGVVTAGLAAVAVWSALDTRSAHDAYVSMPSQQGWDDGRSKQTRTNILLGSAAGAGVVTALVAVFWTRWHGPRVESDVAITPTRDGGLTLSLSGGF